MFEQLMPTDSYEMLLTRIILRAEAVTVFRTRRTDVMMLLDNIEDNFILNAYFRLEVMTLLGIQWPSTFENEKLKARLSRDLILWFKQEDPNALFTLTNGFFY
ncbi:hypothetical protein INT47_006608 [Mucor saturninus]|uniref:Uncharacterized protein n=1 Tax=Mucor saturninus TaxID=64648 RepID=A0A8H7UYH9_9FUNG|nr:hypothetical protein INT47_006608 [Mucor saturninus]